MFHKFFALLSLVAALLIFSAEEFSFADPIYRTKNHDGVVEYSSKPKSKDEKPAQLPSIARARFGEIKVAVKTCAGHGGINCQAGADKDGSVICYDKFTESIQRFAVSCSGAKLVVIPESIAADGERISLVLRNTSSVEANGIKIFSNSVIFQGPTKLQPLGSAEYSAIGKVSRSAPIDVTCDNCP